jgi:hypothetical protein
MKRKYIISAAATAVTIAAVAVAGTAIAPAAGLVGGVLGVERGLVPIGLFREHGEDWSIEGPIASVEAELAITDAQRPQWDALATAVRANVGPLQEAFKRRHGAMGGDENKRRSAVERLDAFEDMAEVGITALRNISHSFKALYAVSSEEQRERADSLINHHRHGRKMHH